MLALKLLLVPCFALLVSLAGRRWGAHVAGWLAGLPVVAGLFSSRWARPAVRVPCGICGPCRDPCSSLVRRRILSFLPSVSLAYADRSLGAWFAAALLLSMSPSSILTSIPIALATLLLAPHAFPKTVSAGISHHVGRIKLRSWRARRRDAHCGCHLRSPFIGRLESFVSRLPGARYRAGSLIPTAHTVPRLRSRSSGPWRLASIRFSCSVLCWQLHSRT